MRKPLEMNGLRGLGNSKPFPGPEWEIIKGAGGKIIRASPSRQGGNTAEQNLKENAVGTSEEKESND